MSSWAGTWSSNCTLAIANPLLGPVVNTSDILVSRPSLCSSSHSSSITVERVESAGPKLRQNVPMPLHCLLHLADLALGLGSQLLHGLLDVIIVALLQFSCLLLQQPCEDLQCQRLLRPVRAACQCLASIVDFAFPGSFFVAVHGARYQKSRIVCLRSMSTQQRPRPRSGSRRPHPAAPTAAPSPTQADSERSAQNGAAESPRLDHRGLGLRL